MIIDDPPFTLNCFCRIVESNFIVHFCLSDNPEHDIIHLDRARHACEFANVTADSLSPIEPASIAASYYKAMLKKRQQSRTGTPWSRTLERAMAKIVEHLKTNGRDWNMLDSDVHWWYSKICDTLRENGHPRKIPKGGYRSTSHKFAIPFIVHNSTVCSSSFQNLL